MSEATSVEQSVRIGTIESQRRGWVTKGGAISVQSCTTRERFDKNAPSSAARSTLLFVFYSDA